MHAYVVAKLEKATILFESWKSCGQGTYSNITIAIVYYLIGLCGLSMVDIANKVVCFGTNGVQ